LAFGAFFGLLARILLSVVAPPTDAAGAGDEPTDLLVAGQSDDHGLLCGQPLAGPDPACLRSFLGGDLR